MQTSVKTNPGAIGYMSLGDLDEKQVKAVKFNGVSPTTENVANGTYKMSRPFVLATKGEATGAAGNFIKWIKNSSNAKKNHYQNGICKSVSGKNCSTSD